MTDYLGKILNVQDVYPGSEVKSTHAIGVSVLSVYNANDFSDEGGSVDIEGLTYPYTTKDDDLDTVTLSTTLTVGLVEGDRVLLYPIASQKRALVQVDDLDDAVWARVPHSLKGVLDAIVRDGFDEESVILRLEDDDYVIHDVIAADYTVLGEALDPDTIPEPPATDGDPPASSPAVTVKGGVSYMYLTWSPIANNDLVTYEVHAKVDDATPLSSSYGAGTKLFETGATAGVARTLQDGTIFEQGVVYEFGILAKDDDGPAAAGMGTLATGSLTQINTPDIAVNAAWVGTMTVDRLIGGDMNADVLLASGKIEARGAGIVGMSGGDGFYVKGAVPAGGGEDNRPLLISFPVNGDPNIIAGQLSATTALIKEGAILRGSSSLEAGASFVLQDELTPPKNAPALTSIWDYFALVPSGTFEGGYQTLMTRGHDGNIHAIGSSGGFPRHWVFNGTTGAYISGPTLVNPGGGGATPTQILYNPFRNCYYIFKWNGALSGSLYVYDTSFNAIQGYTISIISNESSLDPPMFGVDYGNGDLLMWVEEPGFYSTLFGFTTNSNGTPVNTPNTSSTYNSNYQVGFGSAVVGKQLSFIGAGEFDYGAGNKKFVVKTVDATQPFRVYTYSTTSPVYQSGRAFPAAFGANVHGAWYNSTLSKFQSARNDFGSLFVHTYEGGETNFDKAASASKWWVGYSWHDNVVTTHETTLSPYASIEFPLRSKLSVTVDEVPGAGGTDEPNGVQIYMGKLNGSTAPTTANMFFRLRLASTLQGGVVAPGTNGSAFSTNKAADFLASTASEIRSNDGGSYWRGDDTAKFLQLNVDSSTDASTAADNKPALRVGPPAGSHLRIDGNEIIAMDSNTVQGALNLNLGGGTAGGVRLGAGDLIKSYTKGRKNSGTTDANGEIQFAHGNPTTPDHCILTPGDGKQYAAILLGSTNITVKVRTSAGAVVGNGTAVDFFWETKT